jgi:hypothetical protein
MIQDFKATVVTEDIEDGTIGLPEVTNPGDNLLTLLTLSVTLRKTAPSTQQMLAKL